MGRPSVETSDVFRALADPTRRVILRAILGPGLPVTEIASALPVSRPAVSKHLRILKEANLVVEQRHGRNRVYSLNPDPLRDVDDWLKEYRIFWSRSLDRLKQFVEADEEERPGKTTRKDRSKNGRQGARK